MKPRTKTVVGDCTGGEVVRVAAGTVRLTHRVYGSQRLAILLTGPALRETRARLWLEGSTPVLEVLDLPGRVVELDQDEVDPLLKGLP
jgi:hypothetical protein